MIEWSGVVWCGGRVGGGDGFDDILLMLSRIIRRSFSTSGHLLTWGETTYGWGRPTNNQFWTPGPVQNFNDITSVSTGEYHLGFVTKDHAVYTVGLSEDGRLGQSSAADTELPRRVSFDAPDIQIKSLSLGSRHSLALTSDGAVYAWGYEGALGVPASSVKTGVPVRIPA
jgi:alpha-tubulin suppressor-like RCC1 family protein